MNESYKQTEKFSIYAILFAAFYFVFVLFSCLFWASSPILWVSVFSLSITLTICCVTWWRCRLVRLEWEEIDQTKDIKGNYNASNLFDDTEKVGNYAHESRQTFDRWVVPAFTLLCGLFIISGTAYLLGIWPEIDIERTRFEELGISGISLFICFACLLTGSFLGGSSQDSNHRWLRPIGQWFKFNFLLFLLSLLVALVTYYNVGQIELLALKVLLVFMLIIGAEMIFNILLEYFRPKSEATKMKPDFESVILSIVTEPSRMVSNITDTLNYQFGFSLSDTPVRNHIKESIMPYFLLMVLLFYGLDCFILVSSRELGIRERFGKPVSPPLEPGLHFKLPVPFEKIQKFPVKELQKIKLGFRENDEEQKLPNRVITWNKRHYLSETNYLLASSQHNKERDSVKSAENWAYGVRPNVPVNVITAEIPIYYKINESQVFDFAYNHNDHRKVLQLLASREIVNFFSSIELPDIMGENRLDCKTSLEQRIRNAVADCKPILGIQIESVD